MCGSDEWNVNVEITSRRCLRYSEFNSINRTLILFCFLCFLKLNVTRDLGRRDGTAINRTVTSLVYIRNSAQGKCHYFREFQCVLITTLQQKIQNKTWESWGKVICSCTKCVLSFKTLIYSAVIRFTFETTSCTWSTTFFSVFLCNSCFPVPGAYHKRIKKVLVFESITQ